MNIPIYNKNQYNKNNNSYNQITFNSIINVNQQYITIIYSEKYPIK